MSISNEQFEEMQARCDAARKGPLVCGSPDPGDQQAVRPREVGQDQGEEGDPRRPHVFIVSFRRRLLDPDGLYGGVKYFLDSLRYAGIIPDDRDADITLEVIQKQVKTKAEETTMISVERRQMHW